MYQKSRTSHRFIVNVRHRFESVTCHKLSVRHRNDHRSTEPVKPTQERAERSMRPMNPAGSYRNCNTSNSIACSIDSTLCSTHHQLILCIRCTIDNYQAIRLYLCLPLFNKMITCISCLMHFDYASQIDDRQIATIALVRSQLQQQALINIVYSLNNYNRSMHHRTTAHCIPMTAQNDHMKNMWDRTRIVDQRCSQQIDIIDITPNIDNAHNLSNNP